ncbi:MAG TPA: helix-turn-helix domain-containing protein [Acidimicrobiales bacterium]|nr:helix-turn-helix domain-containing protein [Acidimicrobiales bacterium]
MDFRHPVQAVVPGVQGRILAVLAETTGDLSLRTIARLADVSPAQASRVLPQLVRLGIVDRRDAPPTALFRFVPENVASQFVHALSRSRDQVLAQLGRQAAQLPVRPLSVIVFGSLARGEADGDSDIDAVFVRVRGTEERSWVTSVDLWSQFAHRLTGNRVEVLEVDEADIGRLLRGRKPLWADIVRDGLVVFGADLQQLGGRHSA